MDPQVGTGTDGARAPRSDSPVTLSAAAAAKILDLMTEKDMAGSGLRVFVQGGGCSGLQYGMAFVDEADEGDLVYTCEGLRVHVDPVSIRYMVGAHIDVVQTPGGTGFKIDNPAFAGCGGCQHATAEGGCGGHAEDQP